MADPIANERDKRQSMAQQTLGLADDFEAKYPGKKDLHPIHLSEPADNGQANKQGQWLLLWKKGCASQQRADAPQQGTQPAIAEGGQSQRLARTKPKYRRNWPKGPSRVTDNGQANKVPPRLRLYLDTGTCGVPFSVPGWVPG
jgi:hypothetical protein